MFFLGKYKILSTVITACDYNYIIREIQSAIVKKKKLLISPVASHTLVRSYFDKELKKILDSYNALYSDSQWVKIALNFLYKQNLKKRVYGPKLLLKVCEIAQKKQLRVFFYGTDGKTIRMLKRALMKKYPRLIITGALPSKFKPLTLQEQKKLGERIQKAKTQIFMIGLGSPLEQEFAHNFALQNRSSKYSLIIIPFGAAFDFISGVKPQAPEWVGDIGFEWLFRLLHEPRRLWKRYLIYGPLFIMLILFQKAQMLFNGIYNKIPKINFFGKKGE